MLATDAGEHPLMQIEKLILRAPATG